MRFRRRSPQCKAVMYLDEMQYLRAKPLYQILWLKWKSKEVKGPELCVYLLLNIMKKAITVGWCQESEGRNNIRNQSQKQSKTTCLNCFRSPCRASVLSLFASDKGLKNIYQYNYNMLENNKREEKKTCYMMRQKKTYVVPVGHDIGAHHTFHVRWSTSLSYTQLRQLYMS